MNIITHNKPVGAITLSFKEMQMGDIGTIVSDLHRDAKVMKIGKGSNSKLVRLVDGDFWSLDRAHEFLNDCQVMLLGKHESFTIFPQSQ